MSRFRAVLMAFVALVVGAGGASWFWLGFNGKFMQQAYVAEIGAGITTRVAVLDRIRAGNPAEATAILETMLDSDLAAAASLARKGVPLGAGVREAVLAERKARQASGYQPSDESVRKQVQEALATLGTGSPAPAPGTAPR